MNVLLLCIGGGIGAVLRAMVTARLSSFDFFKIPITTLFVNLLGSFLIGYLFQIYTASHAVQLFFAVGILGGFTTFSTLSLELLQMLQQSKKRLLFVTYSVLQYGACFIACWLGVQFHL
ncbi:fluoride efflux transporter FluC [Staphylococcus schleiferi]|uniref:fluoride efflux transporter FluC n=1 Tax=Staphylococcus schleiferi TaxID=1295 RepID=UPI00247FCCFB|nr:CrcB family protein [Staphylococcus schleiferi]